VAPAQPHKYAADEKFPLHGLLVPAEAWLHNDSMLRCSVVSGWASVWLGLMALVTPARAAILWSDPGPTLVHENGAGTDILRSAVKRDNTSSDTLYFKFHVDPLSDVSSELYAAGFQLFEGNMERLGVGNSMKAWAYSAFNTAETGTNNQVPGDMDLRSASPESYHPGSFLEYELPRRGVGRTIVFKVQFVPGGDDLVTVWVHPDLVSGATEASQPESLTTHFKADASFDQIHLRHEGGGDGWTFSDMAIATSFNDFIVPHFWERRWFIALVVFLLLVWTATTIRLVERRRYQHQLQRAAQERALERERARIAQDLHDDLGSSLTRISLLSTLLQADKDEPEQVTLHAGKLSEAADQTVRALEEIVWAVRPGSDSLQSLVEYIAHFANEAFEDNPTRCRLDLPHDLPAKPLPPDVRHNIFLIVKEALTNALRHAGAKEVHVQAKVSADSLEILVQDDGCGFEPAMPPMEGKRHGLGNMRRRAEAIGGTLELQSTPGKGTSVRLVVHLANGTGPRNT
jgi:signal transduction histidine kinase